MVGVRSRCCLARRVVPPPRSVGVGPRISHRQRAGSCFGPGRSFGWLAPSRRRLREWRGTEHWAFQRVNFELRNSAAGQRKPGEKAIWVPEGQDLYKTNHFRKSNAELASMTDCSGLLKVWKRRGADFTVINLGAAVFNLARFAGNSFKAHVDPRVWGLVSAARQSLAKEPETWEVRWVARALWACARTRLNCPGFLRAAAKTLPGRVEEMDHTDVALALYAFTALGYPVPETERALFDRVDDGRLVDQMNARELSYLALGLAYHVPRRRSSRRDVVVDDDDDDDDFEGGGVLLREVMDAATRTRFHAFEHVDVANFLEALVVAPQLSSTQGGAQARKTRLRALVAACGKQVRFLLKLERAKKVVPPTWPPEILSALTWALAAAGHDEAETFALLGQRCALHNRKFRTGQLTDATWGLAVSGLCTDRAIYEKLAGQAAYKLTKFAAAELPIFAWALSTAQPAAPFTAKLFVDVAREATTRIDEFDGAALADLSWAFANAGHDAANFFEVVSIVARPMFFPDNDDDENDDDDDENDVDAMMPAPALALFHRVLELLRLQQRAAAGHDDDDDYAQGATTRGPATGAAALVEVLSALEPALRSAALARDDAGAADAFHCASYARWGRTSHLGPWDGSKEADVSRHGAPKEGRPKKLDDPQLRTHLLQRNVYYGYDTIGLPPRAAARQAGLYRGPSNDLSRYD